ncbi:Fe-S cluster assembly protein SufD [Microbacterium terrae]|uniref:FeS cluster assembly protein SufD n=1 Tax=Microbacterium terrae TaxID=69369 RepID=A0A0M2H1Z6_9MICO|nr:Fe-S cluster assembly protein SufD [Microbacterium terrae]KJL38098.1 FeS cluster assembly protein SufD [Microbacterium terrae]MBP1077511.1 Fe-S cluster assembly protein SufD [Microbacterium terrae]GLJ99116.1 Fe-S cluster assembly protein SufD [Microbacterium terrae]
MTATTQAPVTAPDSRAPGSTPHTDGAWSVIPVQTRSERPTSFDPEDFGAPTGREVNWKHTPVDRVVALFADEPTEDGDDLAIAYGVDAVADHLVESTGHDAAVRGEHFRPEDLPSAIAWKRCANALHLRLAADEELAEPLNVDLVGRGAERHGNAHIIVEALPNSRGTVVLHHSGSAQYAQNVEIIVRDGAALTVISVQRWDDDAVHAASHQARVDRDATLRHIVVSFGGGVVRVNPSVELAGPGARGELYGLSYADAGQHLESQVYLHHKGPDTTGDVLYKGALQGAGAHSVWIGDVLIGPDAAGTDSYEANRNLVLTEGARADSIPNLEIETGDIRGAGHASATGRFDDEQLFYLQARGIAEDEARRLVVLGFLAEIVQKIGVPSLEEELFVAIEAELAQEAAR